MKYHIQTIRGNNGDCFRTALACLLDEENVENVPHFFHDDPLLDEAWGAVRDWLLNEKGLFLVTIPFQGELEGILQCMKVQNPGVYYLVCGWSGCDNHVVIAHEERIVHDPSGRTSPRSLVRSCSDGFYWVKFLLPRFHGTASE